MAMTEALPSFGSGGQTRTDPAAAAILDRI